MSDPVLQHCAPELRYAVLLTNDLQSHKVEDLLRCGIKMKAPWRSNPETLSGVIRQSSRGKASLNEYQQVMGRELTTVEIREHSIPAPHCQACFDDG